MAIRPHPQLNFCGLGLESTLLFVRVSRSIKIKVSYRASRKIVSMRIVVLKYHPNIFLGR